MAKLAGKSFRVKVSTTSGGTFTAVLSVSDGSIDINGTTIDVSEFGDTWMERLQALKDASYSLKGFYNAADSTGQTVIQSSLINDSALFVQMLPDGTAGFKQQVIVSKYSVGAPVNGVCSVEFSFEGNGTLTLI